MDNCAPLFYTLKPKEHIPASCPFILDPLAFNLSERTLRARANAVSGRETRKPILYEVGAVEWKRKSSDHEV
jgi:hypothetical protein